ncbi:MAG: CoA transferase [Rhodospirillaceae bacterium]|nr:CoA transferase [Rhodospirillaceae bacterium]
MIRSGSDRPGNRPLDGIRIVEAHSPDAPLDLRLAGALAGRIAADLGAAVSFSGPPPSRRDGLFAFLNAGKRWIPALRPDRSAADVAIVDDRLFAQGGLAKADVTAVLSTFAAGAPAMPASAFTVMALGGLLDIVGDPEREPLRLGGHQMAYAAGLAAYTGIAAALCGRGKRTSAEVVRVNMLDTAIWLNWKSAPVAGAGEPPPTRSGRAAEWQVLRCADGYVVLVYQEGDWAALKSLVGDPRLEAAHLETRPGRLMHLREIAAIIEAAFMRHTRAEIRARALEKRLPLGPIWSPRELDRDEQTLARAFLCRMDEGMTLPRLPVLWSGRAFPPGAIPAVAIEAEALS